MDRKIKQFFNFSSGNQDLITKELELLAITLLFVTIPNKVKLISKTED